MAKISDFEQFASALEEPGAGGAHLRLRQPGSLTEQDLERWTELASTTSTASAFAQPWFLQAALRHCDPEQSAHLAVVELSDGTWAGALPIARKTRHGRAPLPNWHSWRHPNQFVSAPLVRSGLESLFWQELLEGLGARHGSELALCLADLPVDDPASTALFDLCQIDKRTLMVERRIERPALQANHHPTPEPKQRRRLASLERKLARDLGPLQYRVTRVAEEIEQQIKGFLALENAGWKGNCGSALSCGTDTRNLFTEVMRTGGHQGRMELASLHVGGECLAFSTILIGQGRKYGFKMAFHEGASQYAPGVLLLNWLTTQHCQSGGDQMIDSCTDPESGPAARMWRDRCALVDCRIAIGSPMRRGAMLAIAAGESAYSWLKRLGATGPEPAKP